MRKIAPCLIGVVALAMPIASQELVVKATRSAELRWHSAFTYERVNTESLQADAMKAAECLGIETRECYRAVARHERDLGVLLKGYGVEASDGYIQRLPNAVESNLYREPSGTLVQFVGDVIVRFEPDVDPEVFLRSSGYTPYSQIGDTRFWLVGSGLSAQEAVTLANELVDQPGVYAALPNTSRPLMTEGVKR